MVMISECWKHSKAMKASNRIGRGKSNVIMSEWKGLRFLESTGILALAQ